MFRPSPLFVPDDQLGAPFEDFVADKGDILDPHYGPYKSRTIVDYCNKDRTVRRDEYYCHGRLGLFFKNYNDGTPRRVTYTVTHLTDRETRVVDHAAAALEWWRLIFDPDKSPWRRVLPAFIPIWDKSGELLRSVVLRDHGQSAKPLVNFLIAARYPTFLKDGLDTYVEARKLGASVPVAMLVSQISYRWCPPWFEPRLTVNRNPQNRFWFHTNSVKKFLDGEMGLSTAKLNWISRHVKDLPMYTSGVPNIRIWNGPVPAEDYAFGRAHVPYTDPDETRGNERLIPRLVEAMYESAETGRTHSKRFTDCFGELPKKEYKW
jgi:hypothetical protein